MSNCIDEDCRLNLVVPAFKETIEAGAITEKIVADVVHSSITLHPLCVHVIDTLEFQRLRNISQCALASFVYPSAKHSRFEHSIGVYHLAREMMAAIMRNSNEKISEVDQLCVMLAALCHDIGHGAFSHTWEGFLHRYPAHREWKHEENSVAIFHHLIMKNNLADTFMRYGIGNEQLKFISNLILGDSSTDLPERQYLYEIVANRETSIDVDKWDYMMRDGLYFAIPWQLNYHRILSGISIYFNKETKTKTISFRDKLADSLLEMFEFRGKMHKKCYQHIVCKTLEIMLLDSLEAVNDHFQLFVGPQSFKLSECHESSDAFVQLSDYIFYEIMNSNDERLQPAANLLKRICRRQLYTVVGRERLLKPGLIDELAQNTILEEMEKKHQETFCLSFSYVNVGTSADPLESVTFLNKNQQRKFITSPEGSRFNYTEILCFCTKWFADKDQSYKVEEMKSSFKLLLSKYLPSHA